MKRITTILLAVMLIAALFISCENNVVENNIEETVSVDFEGSRSRNLTATLETFNKDNLYWKYTAVKNDKTGLNSGATEDGAEKVKSDGSKGLGTVSGFSQGSWKFTLYAYKTNTGGTYSDLQYQGTVTTSLKKGSTNSILVTVSPVKTEGKGTLKIDDGITITKDGVAITTNEVTQVYKVVKVGDTDTDTYSATTSYTLDPGAYKVTVAFADNGYVYASGSVVATVYSNLTTTVTGSLEELRTDATFDSEINPDVMNTVATSKDTAYSTLSTEGASAVTLSDSASTNKVSATVSATSAKTILENIVKGDNTTVTVDNSTTVSLAISVDTTAATESTLDLEIGLSATVKIGEVSTTESISSISDYATVTINLQKGLTSVVVKHSGEVMAVLESADAAPSGENAGNGGYYYDNSTGVLTIKTKTFSPFAVSYDTPVYVAKVGSKHYTTLEAAVKAITFDETITLLDCSLSNEVPDGYESYTWTVVHTNCDEVTNCWHEKSSNFDSGYGTKIEPYLVATKEQFQNITKMYDKYAYYKLSDSYSDTDLTGWTPVTLHGSFDGNGKKLTNVTACLFSIVGYKLENEEILLNNFEATLDISALDNYSTGSLVKQVFNSGTTTFKDIKVHGKIEGYWNLGSFYNYGTANYDDKGKSYTAKFENCKSDATLICSTGNNGGGFVGHGYEGADNALTLSFDSNCEFTGEFYTINRNGHKYIAMWSSWGDTNDKITIGGTEYTGSNWDENWNEYNSEKNKKIAQLIPTSTNNGYTVSIEENVSYVVVSVSAQLTAYDEAGTELPNAKGITLALGNEKKDNPTIETNLLSKVTSAEINNSAGNSSALGSTIGK